jgi:tetratricopeptide (TPR) repeat protein
MNRPGRGTVYSITMVAVVGGLVLIGALALALMNSSAANGPAFPVTVFGDPRTFDKVIALPAIRPAERAALPQGSLDAAELLPMPVTPSWSFVPKNAADSLYARVAGVGMQSELDRARAAAQAGTRDRALFLYDEIRSRLPADRALLIEHASVLSSFGEHRKATALLRSALARSPHDYELAMLAARNAWWAEDPIVADSLTGIALAERPSDPEAVRLRETIRTTSQPPLAVARDWAAETGAPRENLLLARALVRDGQYAPAIAPYRVALTDPRLHTDSLLLEAASAAAAADSVVALDSLTGQYLLLHPTDAAATLRVARAYSWRGDYAAAMRKYDQLDWSDPALRLEVAQVLIWSKQEKQGEMELRTVVGQQPGNGPAWKLLGDVALWRGDYAVAQANYGRAFTIDPSIEGLGAGQLAAAAGLEQARLASMPRPAPNGMRATIDGFGDNQGFRWLSTRATSAFHAGSGTLNASVAQLAYEGALPAGLSRNTGAGLQVDGVFDLRPGLRLTAMAGGESYAAVSSFALFGAGLTVFDATGMQVGLEYKHQPAVSRAATFAALQARATSDVLAVNFASTRGAWSSAARVEGERFASDVGAANRVAAAASLTRTLTPALAATIGLSALRVDRPSPVLPGFGNVLWAPSSYVEPSVALAYRAALTQRLSATAGWQMGWGFANERAGDQRYGTGSIPTATLSGDLLYTSGQWTVGAGGSYGGALVRGYRASLVRIQASYRLGQ